METNSVDGRRARGDRTRAMILHRAMKIASIEGLDGLTIGRLADDVGVRKNHITVLFGNREALQLATLDAAVALFVDRIITPALSASSPIDRLGALCEGWFEYVQGRVFPGGCFLHSVSSEYRARPGRIRDRIRKYRDQWTALLEREIRAILEESGDRSKTHAARLAFELIALQTAANISSLLGDSESFARARGITRGKLEDLARSPPRRAKGARDGR